MLSTAEPLQALTDAPDPTGGPPSVLLRPGRRWLRVDGPTLADALHAVTLPCADLLAGRERSRLGRLQRRGLATDAGLVPWVVELLGTIAGAGRRFELTAFASGEVQRQSAWCSAGQAVVGDHAEDGTLALQLVDPHLLAATFAVAVGHGPRPTVAEADPVDLPPSLLWRFAHALGHGAPGQAAEALRLGSLDLPALRALHGIATGTVRAWRLAAAPAGLGAEPAATAAEHQRLAVLDAGRGGAWLATGDGTTFAPASAEDIWRTLHAALAPVEPAGSIGSVAGCPSCPRWRPSAASSSHGSPGAPSTGPAGTPPPSS